MSAKPTPTNLISIIAALEQRVNTLERTSVQGIGAARAYHAAAQTVAHGGTVLFNSDRYQTTSGMHSTSSNTSRMIAPFDGIYDVGAIVNVGPITVGNTVQCVLRKNGVAVYVADDQRVSATNLSQFPLTPHSTVQLVAGDYIEALLFQNGGAAMGVLASSTTDQRLAEIWMTKR